MRILIPIFVLLISINILAQKTESPYIKVLTKGAIIPLKSTNAAIQIVGKIAHIKITQTYHNKSNKAIDTQEEVLEALGWTVSNMQTLRSTKR